MADRKMFLRMSVKKYLQSVLEKTNLGRLSQKQSYGATAKSYKKYPQTK